MFASDVDDETENHDFHSEKPSDTWFRVHPYLFIKKICDALKTESAAFNMKHDEIFSLRKLFFTL